LRIARDVDPAEEVAGRLAPVDRAHDLVRGRLGLGMTQPGDELARRLAAADGDPAELEMRPLCEPHNRFNPGVIAPAVDHEQLSPPALCNVDANSVEFRSIAPKHHALAPRLAGRDGNVIPFAEP